MDHPRTEKKWDSSPGQLTLHIISKNGLVFRPGLV